MKRIHLLRSFFREERDHHGAFFGASEDVVNASYRRASCRTDQELLDLLDATREFANILRDTLRERDDVKPRK